jgi:hypothetical protein
MNAFPDIGFPYAVFHRLAGAQPPWVMEKSWQLSDDENDQSQQIRTTPVTGDPASSSMVREEFQQVIEELDTDTSFDEARVR